MKLSLSTPRRNTARKEVQLRSFLALEVSGQYHAPTTSPSGKEPQYPFHGKSGWPRGRSGRFWGGKRGLWWGSSPGPSIPWPTRYTDWATPAPVPTPIKILTGVELFGAWSLSTFNKTANGVPYDAALHQGGICCQNIMLFNGTHVPVIVFMSLQNSTAIPAPVFTKLRNAQQHYV